MMRVYHVHVSVMCQFHLSVSFNVNENLWLLIKSRIKSIEKDKVSFFTASIIVSTVVL